MTRARTSSLAAVAIAALLCLAGAAPAGAATDAGAVAALNAQRAAHGIPGGVAVNSAWSADCAAHNGYMRANGLVTHNEVPGAPGYSAGGAWAGPNAVLASNALGSVSWRTNPWENAPYHLAQLLQPGLASAGYADNGFYACMTTRPGVDSAAHAGRIFTYPGDGRQGVSPAQSARELPSTPQQAVGIAATATTGPNLLVFAPGRGAVRVAAASLTPPVQLRWVDNTTPNVGGMVPPGAILVPVTPLQPQTTYAASVALTGAGGTATHTWRFTTSAAASSSLSAAPARLSAAFAVQRGRRVRITGTAGGSPVVLTIRSKRRGAKVVRRRVRTAASGVFSGSIKASGRGPAEACALIGRLRLCRTVRV